MTPRSQLVVLPRRSRRAEARSLRALAVALVLGSSQLCSAIWGEVAPAVVKGSVSVAGKSTALEHIALGTMGEEAIIVLVTDRALPPSCDVFAAMAIAEKEPLIGVQFTVHPETLDLRSEGGINLTFYPGISITEGYSKIKSGLTLERKQEGWAQGMLVDSIQVGDKTLDVSIELEFPLVIPDPPIAPRVVIGADSKPGRAFAELVDAIVAGDLEAMKELSVAELESQMSQIEPEEAAEMIAMFADFLLPVEITITDSKIEKARAVLSAKGRTEACLGLEESTGQIELVREKRKWKVASVKFEG